MVHRHHRQLGSRFVFSSLEDSVFADGTKVCFDDNGSGGDATTANQHQLPQKRLRTL